MTKDTKKTVSVGFKVEDKFTHPVNKIAEKITGTTEELAKFAEAKKKADEQLKDIEAYRQQGKATLELSRRFDQARVEVGRMAGEMSRTEKVTKKQHSEYKKLQKEVSQLAKKLTSSNDKLSGHAQKLKAAGLQTVRLGMAEKKLRAEKVQISEAYLKTVEAVEIEKNEQIELERALQRKSEIERQIEQNRNRNHQQQMMRARKERDAEETMARIRAKHQRKRDEIRRKNWEQVDVMSGLTGVGSEVIQAMTSPFRDAMEYQVANRQTESKLFSEILNSQDRTEKMKSLIEQSSFLGATTKFTGVEVSAAQSALAGMGVTREMMLGGQKFDPSRGGLVGQVLTFSQASDLEMPKAAKLLLSTAKQFKYSLAPDKIETSIKKVMDTFAKLTNDISGGSEEIREFLKSTGAIAGQMGERADLAKMAAFMNATVGPGLPASEAGTAFRGVMLKILSPTKSGEGALASLGDGISTTDDNGNFRGIKPVFKDIAKYLDGKDIAKKAKLLTEVFTEEQTTAVLNILQKMTEKQEIFEKGVKKTVTGIDALVLRYKKLNDEARKQADIKTDHVRHGLDMLSSSVWSLSKNVGEQMIPVVNQASGLLSYVVQGVDGAVSVFPSLTGAMVGLVATAGLGAAGLGAVGVAAAGLPFVLKGAAAAMRVLQLAQLGLNAAAWASPYGRAAKIALALAGAVASWDLLSHAYEKVMGYFSSDPQITPNQLTKQFDAAKTVNVKTVDQMSDRDRLKLRAGATGEVNQTNHIHVQVSTQANPHEIAQAISEAQERSKENLWRDLGMRKID